MPYESPTTCPNFILFWFFEVFVFFDFKLLDLSKVPAQLIHVDRVSKDDNSLWQYRPTSLQTMILFTVNFVVRDQADVTPAILFVFLDLHQAKRQLILLLCSMYPSYRR